MAFLDIFKNKESLLKIIRDLISRMPEELKMDLRVADLLKEIVHGIDEGYTSKTAENIEDLALKLEIIHKEKPFEVQLDTIKSLRSTNELLKSMSSIKTEPSREEKIKRLKEWGFNFSDGYLTEFLISHWEGTEKIAKASGKKSSFLFGFALEPIKEIINERTWPGIVEIAAAIGEDSWSFFGEGISAIKDPIKEDIWIWPGIVKIVVTDTKNSKYSIKYGAHIINIIRGSITEKTWPMFVEGIIKMTRTTGDNSEYLWGYEITALEDLLKDMVNEKNWLMITDELIKMANAVGDGLSHLSGNTMSGIKDLMNETTFPKITDIIIELIKEYPEMLISKDLTRTWIIKRLNGEEINKEKIIKSTVKEILGFVPEGDIDGLFKFALTRFNDSEKASIRNIFSSGIKKEFPLGKEYGSINVTGIMKLDQDPVELVDILVTVLLTPRKKKELTVEEMLKSTEHERYIRFLRRYSQGRESFDINKLQAARNYMMASDLNVSKVFKDIQKDFRAVRERRDKEAAKRIIDYLSNLAQRGVPAKVEPLSDIIMSVKSVFTGELKFNMVIAKMQSGVATDLFDSEKTMCCAFYPDGANKEASLGYLEDQHMGLLQLKAADKRLFKKPTEIEIIGVAIMVVCTDIENNKKVLLVDSVEGNGNYLDVMKEKQWKELFLNSIKMVKRDIKADYIIFNKNVRNTTPNKFNDYLQNMNLPIKQILLQKSGILEQRYLEAFGGWQVPRGNVTGFYIG